MEKNVEFTREPCTLKLKVHSGPKIAVGNIMISKSDLLNQMFWKLLKLLEELLLGRDAPVRCAIIQVVNSDKRPCLCKTLLLIEVNAKDEENPSAEIVNKPSVENSTLNAEPGRNAVIVCLLFSLLFS